MKAPQENFPGPIAEIDCGRRNHFQITFARRGGVELRRWFESPDGSLRPSGEFVEFGLHAFDGIIDGLQQAKSKVESGGRRE